MKGRAIRIVVAESLPEGGLRDAFMNDSATRVEAVATDGLQAVALTRELRPDAVVIDAQMRRIDGFEATRRIMSDTPTPIVIVAEHIDSGSVQLSMEALRAGALSAMRKPMRAGSAEFNERSAALIETVRAMADVKVVRRRLDDARPRVPAAPPPRRRVRPSLIAIGASTGGPAALYTILSALPHDIGAPIVVTQHISRGFTGGMVRWLEDAGPLHVKVAEAAEVLRPGTVYVADDDRHLQISPERWVVLADGPLVDGHRPSATVMFESVARAYGPKALAVILTGMGRDGVTGLAAVHSGGGTVYAQDEASSVVFGMPQAAIDAGVTDAVLPLDAIAGQLILAMAPS